MNQMMSPMAQQMMQNPQMMQQVQQMMQDPQAMQNAMQMMGQAQMPTSPGQGPPMAAMMGQNPQMAQMMAQMMQGARAAPGALGQQPPMSEAMQRAQFAQQLTQLASMGFDNEAKCLEALLRCNGN